uniref:Uncharacterized protein n=1 Tax=Parascaris equorum TaxID=6256 RepID=A0A914R0P7_PAREQ
MLYECKNNNALKCISKDSRRRHGFPLDITTRLSPYCHITILPFRFIHHTAVQVTSQKVATPLILAKLNPFCSSAISGSQ